MAKIDDPDDLLSYVYMTYAPYVNKHYNGLLKTGKLPPDATKNPSEWHNIGQQALLRAIHTYKPEFGDFTKHAEQNIRYALIAHADKQYKVPKSVRTAAKQYERQQKQEAPQVKSTKPSQPALTAAPAAAAPAVSATSAPAAAPAAVDKSMIPAHLHDLYDKIYKKS